MVLVPAVNFPQGVCGFLQVYFYTLRRENPEEWKCQPHRFLTSSNEMHEIIVGTTNMTIAGAVSGLVTCWVVNGRHVAINRTPLELHAINRTPLELYTCINYSL